MIKVNHLFIKIIQTETKKKLNFEAIVNHLQMLVTLPPLMFFLYQENGT